MENQTVNDLMPATCHLGETGEFNERYIDALAIPNLDPDEFPSVSLG